jgi:hypothetical protein
MVQKHYYIVKNMPSNNGGVYPMMLMNNNPTVYGPPMFKPSMFPDVSTYEFRISAPNTQSFSIKLSPALAQRLMMRFFEKQRFEKNLGNDVKIEFLTPRIEQNYSMGYAPFYQGISPFLTQPMPQVDITNMAGYPMTNDQILTEIKKNL